MKFSTMMVLSLLLAVSFLSADSPKNVIFYIGDGMGFEQVEAAEIYTGTAMSFSDPANFPYTADCTTYSANNTIPDSAAAGTSLATAVKVNNDVISMAYPGDHSELLTLLEYFKAQGKSVGLVTTTYLTHATPATFGAHEPSRSNYSQIGNDYLTQTVPNVLFGGGGNGLTVSATQGAGYTVTDTTAGFFDAGFLPDGDPGTAEYFSAQFGSGYMPYKEDYLGTDYPYPLLDEMTAKAIEILSEDPDGFFLMVEGGRVDHACHSNWIRECVHEVIDFSNAVQVGHDWAAGRTDTLVIVTADHETGGLSVDGTVDGDGYPVASWTTTGHSSANVPVYAWGINADLVLGTMDNTDMFHVCTVDNEPVVHATNPYPHDGQVNVTVDVILAWTPGLGAEKHQVRVWTDSDPNLVTETVLVPEYELLACAPGTIHYWAVDELDANDNLLAEGEVWTFTTVSPPGVPTNLNPGDGQVAPVDVILSWTAADNAVEYWIYLDTVSPPVLVVSKQSDTTYAPPNLSHATTYYWQVVAMNSAGEGASVVSSFATEDLLQPETLFPIAENTVKGTLVSGDMAALQSSDDGYEVLEEVVNVPNKNGYSKLEHVWTFEVGNAVSAEFYVEAHKTVSTDGDDFVFSYSADGDTYTDMLTVVSTEDTNAAQVYVFPTPPSGTVYVRVEDTDHVKANQAIDRLFIDHMYIYASEGGLIKHYKASQPDPMDGSVDVALNKVLTWTPGDDAVTHNVYFGVGGGDELDGPFVVSSPSFDPLVWAHAVDSEIVNNNTYYWRVDEERGDYSITTGDVWRYTTVAGVTPPETMSVASILLTTERATGPTVYGVATVTIVDNNGDPVEGAEVTGDFTGDYSGDTGLTATTDANGEAVFTSSTAVKKPSFAFTVTDVVKEGLVYDGN